MSARFLSQGTVGGAVLAFVAAVWLTSPHHADSRPSAAPWQLATQLDLIPTPQEIGLDGREHSLEGLRIIRPKGAVLAETGALEINERLRELGHRELEVLDQLDDGPAILLAPCTDPLAREFASELGVTPESPGEQGYVIAFKERQGKPLVLALGSDPPGTLYAAETLRQLIQPRGGKPVLLGARVRDWPAFKLRNIGQLRVPLTDTDRLCIKWLARHKINYAILNGPWGYVGGYQAEGAEREKLVREAREVVDLAHRYGVNLRLIMLLNIDVKDEDWTDCIFTHPNRGGRRYCWTATKEHEWKSSRLAQWVKDIGIDYLYLHAVDGGGYQDPENWMKRCARCRKAYRDDECGRATADLFKLYRRKLDEAKLDCHYSVVVYPYQFQWTIPGFAEDPIRFGNSLPSLSWIAGTETPEKARTVVDNLNRIHRTVAEALPDDTFVVFREGGPGEFSGVARLWEGHPIEIYGYHTRVRGWRGLWEPQQRLTKTWHRTDKRDCYYNPAYSTAHGGMRGWVLPGSCAEYVWNVNVPDAEPTFDISKRYYDTEGRKITDFQKESLLPRVLRQIWGESWQAFSDVFENNVSWWYLANPQEVLSVSDGERFVDPYEHYPEQLSVILRAQGKINQLAARLDKGEVRGIHGDLRKETGYEFVLHLYRMVNLAAARGELEMGRVKAQRLAEGGQPAAGLNVLDGCQKRLPAIRAQLQRVEERLAADGDRTSLRWAGNEFKDFSISQEEARLEELRNSLQAMHLSGTIPEHLRGLLGGRVIKVAPRGSAVAIDGEMKEPCWQDAQVVELFRTAGGRHLAPYDSQVRLLWDEKGLYIHANLWEEPGVELQAKAANRDEDVLADDSLAVLISSVNNPGDFKLFGVNPAGTRFDESGVKGVSWNADWEVSARRLPDGGWSSELYIPWTVLKGRPKPEDAWRANIIRNRPARLGSLQSLSCVGSSEEWKDTAGLVSLILADTPVANPTEGQVKLTRVERKNQTTNYGFATLLWLRPQIESIRSTRAGTLKLEVLDRNQLIATREEKIAWVVGLWRPRKEIQLDLGKAYDGDLTLKLTSTAEDGSLDAKAVFLVKPSGEVVPVK